MGADQDSRIGVVVGMKSEAALLAPSVMIGISGGVPALAEAAALALADQGAVALISFGIAGGLSPELRPGDLVVATGVIVDGDVIETDAAWRARLSSLLPEARLGLIAGAAIAVDGVDGKQDIYRKTSALAVDLESAALARAAKARGLPFAVLRAIADPAHRALPKAALVGLGADGAARPGRVVLELLRRPWDLPGLIRLAGESGAALKSLGAAGRILGPRLGFQQT